MAFSQIHPENAGFVQPGNGYSRLRDAQNPAAIAYASHMLALHGIQVPRGADPTALWRVYSAKLAGQRATASQAAAGESPDMGVTPGSIPASNNMQGQTPRSPVPGPALPDGGRTFPGYGGQVAGGSGTYLPRPDMPRGAAPMPEHTQMPPASAVGLIRAIMQARMGRVPGAE